MNAALLKECLEAIKRNRQLGIRPKMEVEKTNGMCTQKPFDLRSLNGNLIKKE